MPTTRTIVIGLCIIMAIVGCDTTNKKVTFDKSSIHSSFDKIQTTDTLYHYWQIDTSIHAIDTVSGNLRLTLKTYCLNDSSLFSEPFVHNENGDEVVAYYVAHNYESKVILQGEKEMHELTISKESFKDSLSEDFLTIAHLWSNRLESIKNGRVYLRASVAKPDTDYQFDIIYTILESGAIKIDSILYSW